MPDVPGDAGLLKIRLFMEGIEVPVISATVNIGIGAPASCVLQIIPTDRAMEFLPRTMVHLFYYDFQGELTGDYSTKEGETEADLFDKYKLFFSGEVVTAQETRSAAGNRAVVLQCLDFSVYWDTAYQYMLTFGPNGSGIMGSPAKFLGANDYLFDDITNDPVSVVSGLISRGEAKSTGLRDVKGLMGGIIRVLETMGGVWYTSDSSAKVRGVNDFFTLAELRLKLLQQIGAESKDDTAQRIFSGKVFEQWLNNSLGAGGTLFSFRDMLRIIFNYIYYDVVPNPVARYLPAEKGTEKDRNITYKVGLRGDGQDVALRNALENQKKFLKSALLYRDQAAGFEELGYGEATPESTSDLAPGVTQVSAELDPVDVKNVWASLVAAQGVAKFLASDADASQRGFFSSAAVDIEIAAGAVAQLFSTPNWSEMREEIVQNTLEYVTSALESVNDAFGTTGAGTVTDKIGEKYSRLYTQIFRPDIWMCSPPRSNVWFPEFYSQFSYQRNYLREVTRLQLTTSMEIVGPDPLLDSYYYAPKVESFRGLDVNDDKNKAEMKNFLLMDHEVYSGIVPKFSHMCESGFFANKALRKLLVSKDKTLSSVFTDRAANYEFFKFRYAPRSMQISGKFAPEKLCGVPGLVIRRGLTLPDGFDVAGVLEMINAGAKEILLGFGKDATGQVIHLPNQYVGMVASLTHSVHQGGGSTNATLTYARQHRTKNGEDDEFLDIQREEVPTRYFTTVYNAQALWEASDTKRIEELKNLTPQTGETDGPTVTQIGMTGPVGGIIRDIQVPDGSSFFVAAGQATSLEVVQSGIGVDTLLWPAVKVIEEITGNISKSAVATLSVEKPFEEVIRPSWYSPIYANTHTWEDGSAGGIGLDFYGPLFGIGAITDGMSSSAGELTNTTIVSDELNVADNSESYMLDAENLSQALAEVKAFAITTEQTISIQKAADYLAALYGLVKSQGQDVQKFVYGYVKRPVATMREILGSPDLMIDKKSGARVQGTEGFHSRAFGPYKDCEILNQSNDSKDVFSTLNQYQRINGTVSRGVDLTADPRLERWKRVNAYMEELGYSRGLRG